jgi:hypothetical protein
LNPDTDFILRKWYLDCVADNGNTFIGYVAQLRWKSFTMHYTSRSLWNILPSTKFSIFDRSAPAINGNQIDWSSRSLGLTGSWKRLSDPVQQQLYTSPEGTVIWSCLQPKSRAEISFGNNQQITGLGYVELLELTLKPWLLPITELRWGRFLSDQDAMTWISWHGKVPFSLILCNGRRMDGGHITDDSVSHDGERIELLLNEKTVLRNDTLHSAGLAGIPGLISLIPEKALQLRECKWRSTGVLKRNGSPSSSGWTIHEIVRFP